MEGKHIKGDSLTPAVRAEFAARAARLRDDYEDAASEFEALHCLECGFRRGKGHAPDCETLFGCPPGLLRVPRSLVGR